MPNSSNKNKVVQANNNHVKKKNFQSRSTNFDKSSNRDRKLREIVRKIGLSKNVFYELKNVDVFRPNENIEWPESISFQDRDRIIQHVELLSKEKSILNTIYKINGFPTLDRIKTKHLNHKQILNLSKNILDAITKKIIKELTKFVEDEGKPVTVKTLSTISKWNQNGYKSYFGSIQNFVQKHCETTLVLDNQHISSRKISSPTPEEAFRVFIYHIPNNMAIESLEEHFGQFGNPITIELANSKRTGFVIFPDDASKSKCLNCPADSHPCQISTQQGVVLCVQGATIKQLSDLQLYNAFKEFSAYGITRIKKRPRPLAFVYLRDKHRVQDALAKVKSIEGQKVVVGIATRQDGSPSYPPPKKNTNEKKWKSEIGSAIEKAIIASTETRSMVSELINSVDLSGLQKPVDARKEQQEWNDPFGFATPFSTKSLWKGPDKKNDSAFLISSMGEAFQNDESKNALVSEGFSNPALATSSFNELHANAGFPVDHRFAQNIPIEENVNKPSLVGTMNMGQTNMTDSTANGTDKFMKGEDQSFQKKDKIVSSNLQSKQNEPMKRQPLNGSKMDMSSINRQNVYDSDQSLNIATRNNTNMKQQKVTNAHVKIATRNNTNMKQQQVTNAHVNIATRNNTNMKQQQQVNTVSRNTNMKGSRLKDHPLQGEKSNKPSSLRDSSQHNTNQFGERIPMEELNQMFKETPAKDNVKREQRSLAQSGKQNSSGKPPLPGKTGFAEKTILSKANMESTVQSLSGSVKVKQEIQPELKVFDDDINKPFELPASSTFELFNRQRSGSFSKQRSGSDTSPTLRPNLKQSAKPSLKNSVPTSSPKLVSLSGKPVQENKPKLSWAAQVSKQSGVGPKLVSLKTSSSSGKAWGAATEDNVHSPPLSNHSSPVLESSSLQGSPQVVPSSLARLAAAEEVAKSDFPSLESVTLAANQVPFSSGNAYRSKMSSKGQRSNSISSASPTLRPQNRNLRLTFTWSGDQIPFHADFDAPVSNLKQRIGKLRSIKELAESTEQIILLHMGNKIDQGNNSKSLRELEIPENSILQVMIAS